MRIAMLSPIAWRTPPRHYGPWEKVASLLTEALVEYGHDVTLYATGDSITRSTLRAVCSKGDEEDSSIIPKVYECLHISELFDHAEEFDIIHNNFDFLPRYIVSGKGEWTLGSKTIEVTAGQSVDIPQKSIHRIENSGLENLVFMEIQTGDYFGEDDIERLADDFGRI